MSEFVDKSPSNNIQPYDKFQGDKEASAELLSAIRIYFRQELDQSGFTKHFIDALNDVVITDSQAQLYIAQTFRAGNDIRVINAVLREQKTDDGFTLHLRKVGEEMNGMRIAARCFIDEDLDPAISQHENLQQLKDSKMISLDQTLSWPADATPLIK